MDGCNVFFCLYFFCYDFKRLVYYFRNCRDFSCFVCVLVKNFIRSNSKVLDFGLVCLVSGYSRLFEVVEVKFKEIVNVKFFEIIVEILENI